MWPVKSFLRGVTSGQFNSFAQQIKALRPNLLASKTSEPNKSLIAYSTAAPAVSKATVEDGGKKLKVQWENGKAVDYHSMWLRFCCPCPQCRDSASNMTSYKIEDIPIDMTIEAALLENGNISVRWAQEKHQAEFDPAFLAEHSYSKEDLDSKRSLSRPEPNKKKEVQVIDYAEITKSDKGLYRWLKIINEDGLCVLKNVPTEYNYIKKVINMIGPILATLYGETFDVKLKADAINLSYSTAALSFHTDLAHYETPPGLQFLHCIEFDQSLQGGETTFIDLYAVGDDFKKQYPEHFKTLCNVPATFQRIHVERDDPVHMIVRKPHFYVNEKNEIIGINWHSHHQGPLSVDPEHVDAYFKAYQLFGRAVVNSPYIKAIRFQPGDLVACNNRRIAHGRNAYTGKGARFLQGGYVSIDEFKSKLMVLAQKYGDVETTKRVFNNDWL